VRSQNISAFNFYFPSCFYPLQPPFPLSPPRASLLFCFVVSVGGLPSNQPDVINSAGHDRLPPLSLSQTSQRPSVQQQSHPQNSNSKWHTVRSTAFLGALCARVWHAVVGRDMEDVLTVFLFSSILFFHSISCWFVFSPWVGLVRPPLCCLFYDVITL
jgi:hypothetical protein